MQFILQGNDGQEFHVEADSKMEAAMKLKRQNEYCDGFSVEALAEHLQEVIE